MRRKEVIQTEGDAKSQSNQREECARILIEAQKLGQQAKLARSLGDKASARDLWTRKTALACEAYEIYHETGLVLISKAEELVSVIFIDGVPRFHLLASGVERWLEQQEPATRREQLRRLFKSLTS